MCNPVTAFIPESLLVKGTFKGFPFEVTTNGFGFRCGYVALPAWHPWFGLDRHEIPAYAHRGIDFAEPGITDQCEHAWWIGFDCAYFGDEPDPALLDVFSIQAARDHMERLSRVAWHLPRFLVGTIKDERYVIDHCVWLAEQASEATKHMLQGKQ